MQLFGLSSSPIRAANELCNQHVNSQSRETTQILYTILRLWNCEIPGPVDCGEHGQRDVYKPTHQHHPCVLWAGACQAHAVWTYLHAKALCAEYHRRHQYTKKHLCEYFIDHWYTHITQNGWPTAMPKTITPAAWLVWVSSMKKKVAEEIAHRIADIHPPDGCEFGVVAIDMIGPRRCPQNDWTGSYLECYMHKSEFAFKKPMQYGLFGQGVSLE